MIGKFNIQTYLSHRKGMNYHIQIVSVYYSPGENQHCLVLMCPANQWTSGHGVLRLSLNTQWQ